ncbi:glycosyltransferase family 4 protein [Dietzia sp.]|uniref:glycosyltransferase family 4 protein n=1 Tax=Dietzia sp. TaxID=1871616 RepID=UPI002FD91B5F
MARTLVITNDYPPRPGGIQSYIESYLRYLDPEDVCVMASTFRGEESTAYDESRPYAVHRMPTSMLLPTPAVIDEAKALADEWEAETVWFGAAAPLAVMSGPLRRGSVRHIVASTHGHEVGWSMVPPARSVLRYIGDHCDAITYVSQYTRDRFAAAFGPRARLIHQPGGVDTEVFRPEDDPEAIRRTREEFGFGTGNAILCLSRLVPRKGQDTLIEALPRIRESVPDARLVIAGGGPYRKKLEELAARKKVSEHVVFTGRIPDADVVRLHQAADVFAMPARTRGAGLDVEGLGIVYLEASACGIPVLAGTSGGAPETVRDGVTGLVADGAKPAAVAEALVHILSDDSIARSMGRAGREWVRTSWSWDELGNRMRDVLLPWDD